MVKRHYLVVLAILITTNCMVSIAQNTATGTPLQTLNGGNANWQEGAGSIAFSPDGSKLVATYPSLGEGPMAIIWDVATGKDLQYLKGGVEGAIFSPDGTKIATKYFSCFQSRCDGSNKIWDVTSGKELHKMDLNTEFDMKSMAFSPDGSKLATACYDGNAYIWDVATGIELNRLKHNNGVASVSFSPDGSKLATGCYDGNAYIWDVATGTELNRLKHDYITEDSNTYTPQVDSVAFSPDGIRLATSARGGKTAIVSIWNVATGERLLKKNFDTTVAITFSPDGSKLAMCPYNYGKSSIWDVANGKELLNVSTYIDNYNDEKERELAFSPDSSKLVATDSNVVRIIDIATGTELQKIDTRCNAVAFSPDGTKIATTYQNPLGTLPNTSYEVGINIWAVTA